jgi:outer membrane protein assembly factor BamE (lipoprotein component of BamABCDE complex)
MYKQFAVLLIVIASGAMAAGVLAFRPTSRRFSSPSWMAARFVSKPSNAENPRALMVDDLLKNHLKVGMTKEEVLAMLGTPDQHGERSFWYNIGSYHRRRFLPGTDQLVVGFDESDKVKVARIAAD